MMGCITKVESTGPCFIKIILTLYLSLGRVDSKSGDRTVVFVLGRGSQNDGVV